MIIHFPNWNVNVYQSEASLTDYEFSVVNFCRSWLLGLDHFEVKTSGSTGAPKPIVISRLQALSSAAMTEKALGLQKGWNALLCLDPNTIAGKMMMVRAMQTGMNLFAVPPSNNPLAQLPVNTLIEFVAMVPLQIQHLLNESIDLKTIGLKAILLGGAPISDDLIEKIQLLPMPTYSSYGMTETVSHIALRLLNTDKKQQAYHVLPQIEIKKDHRDCLCVRGDVTLQQWVVTNDIVEILDERQFIVKGRADLTINSGGVKIQLEEVEKIANQYFKNNSLFNRFFAWGIADALTDKKLVLVVESEVWEEQLQTRVLMELKEKYPKYKAPKKLLFVSKFIETPSQKVDKINTMAAILLPYNL